MAVLESLTLVTPRLELRPFHPKDEDAVYEACQDEQIQRFTTVPSPYQRSDAVAFVQEMSPSGWRSGSAATFAAVHRRDGRLVGAVGLHFDRGRDPGIGEIGYWGVREARGQGLVAEAVRAVAGWGFRNCGVQRLEWYAEVGNDASRRVAEKVGFTIEGVLRRFLVHRERRVDAWVGSLLPGELREPMH